MNGSANVIICGAGIAGVSAAYYLATKYSINDILLIDKNPPLTLTSDHSTECYRNWWPGHDDAMIQLMNRSIDLMEKLAEESNNYFNLNQRGYLYLTGEEAKIDRFVTEADAICAMGAGNLRIHDSTGSNYRPSHPEGFSTDVNGADLILDRTLIQNFFPYVSKSIKAALHVRRAGWLSAQQLGRYLLEGAKSAGVHIKCAEIINISTQKNTISQVHLANGDKLKTNVLINAAGPYLREIGKLIGVDLPVLNELHLKIAFNDQKGIIGRSAPLLIWTDHQYLPWTNEEAQFIREEPTLAWMLGELPEGVHTRVEGTASSKTILGLWEYRTNQVEPVYPIPIDPLYPEIVLRGLVRMLPGIAGYLDPLPRPNIDGGYYTKTIDNRPIISCLPVEGSYVIGALSGFGIMAACAAGELLARMITGEKTPNYSRSFTLERLNDPKYLSTIKGSWSTGQL